MKTLDIQMKIEFENRNDQFEENSWKGTGIINSLKPHIKPSTLPLLVGRERSDRCLQKVYILFDFRIENVEDNFSYANSYSQRTSWLFCIVFEILKGNKHSLVKVFVN